MPLTAAIPGGEIKFDYTFSGEKTRMQISGSEPEDRLYLGGAEFVFDPDAGIYLPDNYQHEEGRKQYRNDDYEQDPKPHAMQYQITGHLGNLAVLFSDANDDGHITSENETSDPDEIEVLQRHFYYPFGMDMDGTWLRVKPYEDRYRYNHKELTKGLGWYAYGARYYDAAVGRFAGVDPIADTFPQLSTFNYASNDPIGKIDLHGLQGVETANFFQALITRWKNQIDNGMKNIGEGYSKSNPIINNSPISEGSKDNLHYFQMAVGFAEINQPTMEVTGTMAALLPAGEIGGLGFAGGMATKGTSLGLNVAKSADLGLDVAKTGTTVLGKYPKYIELAGKLNARRFNIPANVWNKMTPVEQWSANVKFLDRTIARGDNILLSNPVKNINNVSGYFRKELDYLIGNGYRLSKDGTQIIR
jgi:RHS repeat-associated protein